MNLDYTLLNEPTKLLQRLADAEAQLDDIERELIARNTMLPDSKVIKNIIAILDRPIKAAIWDK